MFCLNEVMRRLSGTNQDFRASTSETVIYSRVCNWWRREENWSAPCQYNVTGWVSMWAYDMLSQLGSTIKRPLGPTATNRHLIS